MENIVLNAGKIADVISSTITSALFCVWSDKNWNLETGNRHYMDRLVEMQKTFDLLSIPIKIDWDSDNGMPCGFAFGNEYFDVFLSAREKWYSYHPEDRPAPVTHDEEDEEMDFDELRDYIFGAFEE